MWGEPNRGAASLCARQPEQRGCLLWAHPWQALSRASVSWQRGGWCRPSEGWQSCECPWDNTLPLLSMVVTVGSCAQACSS